MKELIQQLQLMGEVSCLKTRFILSSIKPISQIIFYIQVIYLKSDNEDLVVFNPRWLCNEVLGHLLSHEHLDLARVTGCYSVDDMQLLFPDTDALDLLQVRTFTLFHMAQAFYSLLNNGTYLLQILIKERQVSPNSLT